MPVLKDKQHWIYEDYKQRMTRAEWKDLLLNHEDTIIFKGTIRELEAKDIGFGVVEVGKKSKEKNHDSELIGGAE